VLVVGAIDAETGLKPAVNARSEMTTRNRAAVVFVLDLDVPVRLMLMYSQTGV